MLLRKQPPEVFCWKNVLEGFAQFAEEHMCRSLFFIGKECFPVLVGFAEFLGLLLFIEHLRATGSVSKNTGVTNNEHKINTKHGRSDQCSLSFVSQCLHVSNIFTFVLPSREQIQTGLDPPNGNSNLRTRNK